MNTPARLTNNSVVIQADRVIKKEDLKFLYLYFQTAKYSGGGEVHSFDYDDKQHRIYIRYLQYEFKQAVLRRKRLSYTIYNFQALDPLEMNFTSEKNKRYLIVKNIRTSSDPIGMQLYLDYLAEQNIVSSAKFSSIFESMLFVKFDSDINFASLKQKLLKIPDFDGERIEIYEAYNTNKIVLHLNDEKSTNDLKWYLIQNFKAENGCCCDVSDFKSFPFFIVEFENSFLAMKCLEAKTFDTDFVKCFEACWNDTLTERFISKCASNSLTAKASNNTRWTRNQRENSCTVTSDYNTRFKSQRRMCRFLNNTFDAAENFEDDTFEQADQLTSQQLLNSSLSLDNVRNTQKRMQKKAKNKLPTSRYYLSDFLREAGPSKESKTPSQSSNQTPASSSNVCPVSLENQHETIALDVVESTSSSARCTAFERTAHHSNVQSSPKPHSNSSSRPASNFSFEIDGLEIIENVSGEDDAYNRRKTFIFRSKCSATGRAYNIYFNCKKCPFRCSSKDILLKHKQYHYIKTSFECKCCSFSGKTAKDLEIHKRLHTKLDFSKGLKIEK